MKLLEVDNLSVFYDGVAAAMNINFSVQEREAVVLIGANGAGKSSILHALLGLTPCQCNSIKLQGKEIAHLSTRQRLEVGLGLVPETRELFNAMTVEDNLKLGLFLRKDESTLAEEMSWIEKLFPILVKRYRQKAGTLSGGEQQMLALARALLQKPKVLCLDEPSLGLAPRLVEELYCLLREVQETGVSILLVEQQARRALEFGNRGYVLNVGKIVREGTCRDLADDEYVRSAYLSGGNPL